MKAVLISSLILLAITLPGCADNTAELLIGNWSCESGGCMDEEVAFAIEDGQPTYNSWLHERPSASGGSWQLEGDRLTVECCSGMGIDWTVVRVSKEELVVREQGAPEDTVFKRIGP